MSNIEIVFDENVSEFFNCITKRRLGGLLARNCKVRFGKRGNYKFYDCIITASSGLVNAEFLDKRNVLMGELSFTYDWELMDFNLFKEVFKVMCLANVVADV